MWSLVWLPVKELQLHYPSPLNAKLFTQKNRFMRGDINSFSTSRALRHRSPTFSHVAVLAELRRIGDGDGLGKPLLWFILGVRTSVFLAFLLLLPVQSSTVESLTAVWQEFSRQFRTGKLSHLFQSVELQSQRRLAVQR
jgi:hypothetical protein